MNSVEHKILVEQIVQNNFSLFGVRRFNSHLRNQLTYSGFPCFFLTALRDCMTVNTSAFEDVSVVGPLGYTGFSNHRSFFGRLAIFVV